MDKISFLIVMFAALIIPIVMAHFKITNIPTAVAEIITGIIIGKSVLNIVTQTDALHMMSTLGVMMLMFLSGMEINFDLFKKDPAKKASTAASPLSLSIHAFVVILICSTILAVVLKWLGMFPDVLFAVLLFSTIALGVVIPTLKEKEILNRPAGQALMLTAVLGEVVPMMALTVYASVNGGNAGRLWLIVLLFVAALFLLRKFKEPFIWFNKISKTTTQLDVRLAFFLIFTLVAVADGVGAENILGAFLAGMVMKLLEPAESTENKLTSIGYGFVIPFFFIMTGVNLDLRSLFTNPKALSLIPVLVVCFILAKLPTLLIFRKSLSNKNAFAGSFLMVTTITLVLPALQVAQNLHTITTTQSDAFVLAALIACVLGPIVFNSTYKLERADMIKERVVILGTNIATVPVTRQLSKNWYDIRLVTDLKDNYQTYQKRVPNLTYLPKINEASLNEKNFFDTDILVTAFEDSDKNAWLAKLAKQHGVDRVIAAQGNPDLGNGQFDKLRAQGIEVYNPFNVNVSVLRTMIETPAVLEMLRNTACELFTATVNNAKYVGQPLTAVPGVDKVTISQIFRNNESLSPNAGTILKPGDRVFFVGPRDDAERFQNELK
ncbi:MAG: cation:proton antiporter [Limosilactobacillus pontis]|uniref:Potassium transporter n=1 Tax=Limosilactobacillus pontis TaxID=35787 RepID=A0A2J6NKM6_9LACO|nr:cation:proton antiporter family protein [Limosilactobacillus pontis]PMB81871.1 potassium transporter [Limosilactobacillus pontis]